MSRDVGIIGLKETVATILMNVSGKQAEAGVTNLVVGTITQKLLVMLMQKELEAVNGTVTGIIVI